MVEPGEKQQTVLLMAIHLQGEREPQAPAATQVTAVVAAAGLILAAGSAAEHDEEKEPQAGVLS